MMQTTCSATCRPAARPSVVYASDRATRPIPPEQLLPLWLQVLYTVRSERLLMEELNQYNLTVPEAMLHRSG